MTMQVETSCQIDLNVVEIQIGAHLETTGDVFMATTEDREHQAVINKSG